MRAFIAFFKKELLESIRGGKLITLGCLFVAFGIMNPGIAKLTPWLLEVLSEEMAESGMIVTALSVDALTSWTQFFKNIPMALIVFVFMYAFSFPTEYTKGTLTLIITKGVSRYKIVLAKSLLMLFLWSVGYWLCFGITYVYNSYFWDNSIAVGLIPATINWWLFGVFVVSLIVLWSVVTNSYSGVLLGTGGCVLALYLLGIFPKLTEYMPTSLMNTGALLIGAESSGDYIKTVIISAVASAVCIGVSVPIFNKKRI